MNKPPTTFKPHLGKFMRRLRDAAHMIAGTARGDPRDDFQPLQRCRNSISKSSLNFPCISFSLFSFKKDYPVINRVVPSATVSGAEGRNCCFMVVSCVEKGEGRIWGCFHLALGLIEGESWSLEIQWETMGTADTSCEEPWKCRSKQLRFNVVIEWMEARGEACSSDGLK